MEISYTIKFPFQRLKPIHVLKCYWCYFAIEAELNCG